jgi:hypothetical protein
VEGCGQTLALRSKAVRFISDQDLRVGLKVRVIISWPARLADGVCLALLVLGRIERSAFRVVEIAVSRHEFRTRRNPRLGLPGLGPDHGAPAELSLVTPDNDRGETR